jgi:hypothetical protein
MTYSLSSAMCPKSNVWRFYGERCGRERKSFLTVEPKWISRQTDLLLWVTQREEIV